MKCYTKNQAIEAMQVKRNNINEVLEWCLACEPIFEFIESVRSTSAEKDYLRSFGGFMVYGNKGTTCANIYDYIVKLGKEYIVFSESQFNELFYDGQKITLHSHILIDGEEVSEYLRNCVRNAIGDLQEEIINTSR